MPESREYQQRAVGELRDAVREHGSTVYVLATGGGKTVVAAEIARLAAAKKSRTLFLVHRRELVRQAIETLESAVPGMSIGVEARGWPSMPWAMLHVGMVQTIVRRKHLPDDFKLIIVDEGHHARAESYVKVLARWPNAARILLTATPERLDGKGLWMHAASMVLGPTIPELVRDGHLAPTRTLRLPNRLNLDGLTTDKHGEYRRDAVGERVTETVVADAVSSYLRYARGRQTIFFGIDRAHSERVCAKMREAGIRAVHVDGSDSDGYRDRVMSDFRQGAVQVVGNCDLISEGFDAPTCSCVMLGAPTRSVTRYLQAAGAGDAARPR